MKLIADLERKFDRMVDSDSYEEVIQLAQEVFGVTEERAKEIAKEILG